jgi:Skp family chaperone for outer membrane proteins
MQDNKLKPLFDKINQAAETIAIEKGYDYVFDKSMESNWIYTNAAHDLTEDVISNLQL